MTETVPTGNTYDKYASGNPIEKRMMAGFFASLDAALPVTPPQTILEVGAGEGEVAQRLRERFPEASITIVDLPDDAFDLVLGIEMLEHVPNPRRALEEFARVARGSAVFSVPREPIWRVLNMARGKYWSDLGNTPGHIQHWSSGSFAKLIGSYFAVDTVRRPLPWTVVSGRVTD